MSQLDISISFSQIIGLFFSFYIFIYYIIILVTQYWYNDKLRFIIEEELNEKSKKIDCSIIKRILKL